MYSLIRVLCRIVQMDCYPPYGWWVAGYVQDGKQKWLVVDPVMYGYDDGVWEHVWRAALI